MERLTKRGTRKNGYVSAIGSGFGCWGKIVDRLAAYEDTGLEPEEIDSIFINSVIEENRELKEKRVPKCYSEDVGGGCRYLVPDGDDEPIDKCKRCPLCHVDKRRHQRPSNSPLTLEELREMHGKPVYIAGNFDDDDLDRSGWKVVKRIFDDEFIEFTDGIWLSLNHHCFGVDWRAYRRKPEEGTL